MTFDSAAFQPPLADFSLSQNESYAETVNNNSKKTTTPTQETSHDFFEVTQISNWEDEGRTYLDSPCAIPRDSGLRNISYTTEHTEAAETLMHSGEYEAAYTELEAATDRFFSCKEKINQSFESFTAYLTTLGCRATPHHPVALPLVSLRRKLTA